MSTDGSHFRFNWRPWAAVIAALAVGGVAHRLVAEQMDRDFATRVELPVPLARFPLEIGGWTGVENALDPGIEDYLRRTGTADDFTHRRYTHGTSAREAGFYLVYCARPRSMLGHRPAVCYPANGWVHSRTDADTLTLPGGGSLPVLIHRFRRPEGEVGAIVVLNYYILNGVTTNDEDRFAGFGWRRPNIQGDPAFYVAQVQVSSRSESAARALAAATADRVLDFLPDTDGIVREAQRRQHADGSGHLSPGSSPVPSVSNLDPSVSIPVRSLSSISGGARC